MSGADVTITAVHPSPFRDPTTGDEFDGQEISFVPHSQRSPATPVSSSSDAEVPELSQPAASTEPQAETPEEAASAASPSGYQGSRIHRPASKRQDFQNIQC